MSHLPIPCNGTSSDSWTRLVFRSIKAWDTLTTPQSSLGKNLPREILLNCPDLDTFLSETSGCIMFWFFHLRSAFTSQARLRKWSRDHLDEYVLLPACPGFVMRADCFFISHFWQQPHDPDPKGVVLRLNQTVLAPQSWSYIWIDWTCMPQAPRSAAEERYFLRCLPTMSGIIRNCGFNYFYPAFEPRLWILYEVAEFILTSMGSIPPTRDITSFLQHVDEMVHVGVQTTLDKYGYKSSYERDKEYLIPWLELLVLLHKLGFHIQTVRDVMDYMTWHPAVQVILIVGVIELKKFEGVLVVNGEKYRFTAFPKWVSSLALLDLRKVKS